MAWLKRSLSLVLLIVLIYFFLPLVDELREAVDLFERARWQWLGIALLIQIISYGFLTWLNSLALKPFAGRIGFAHLAAVLTSMAFIQIAIPSAGASGVALRVRLLGKFGYRPEDSLFSLFVETFSEVVALVVVASLGVFYLFQREHLTLTELFWLCLTAASLLIIIAYGWFFIKDWRRSRYLLVKWIRFWNRVGGRYRRLNARQMEARLAAFQHNLYQYRQVPSWKFILAAFGKVLLDVATLGAGFFLFGYRIGPGSLLTGYGLILTFSGVSSLPAGIGMADASVPVIFSWLEVPEAVALASGLVYRLIAFWLVRFVGFFTWLALEARR